MQLTAQFFFCSLNAAIHLRTGRAAHTTPGCVHVERGSEVNIVKPDVRQRSAAVNVSRATGAVQPSVNSPKLPRKCDWLSPETINVALTRVPDLRASSQAGCRLSLRAWKKKRKDCWFFFFFVVSVRSDYFDVAYIRGGTAFSSMDSFGLGRKVSLPVENGKRCCPFFRPWQCERRWWLLVDLSVSSLPADADAACRHTAVSSKCPRGNSAPTVGHGNCCVTFRVAPQWPSVEEMLHTKLRSKLN